MKDKIMKKIIITLTLFLSLMNAQDRFTRDDTIGIITDNSTGMMIQDINIIKNKYAYHSTSTCNDLTLGGFDDWIVPTKGTLLYLSSIKDMIPFEGEIEAGTISRSVITSNGYLYEININDGSIKSKYKNSTGSNSYNTNIRCIRKTSTVDKTQLQLKRDNSTEIIHDKINNIMWDDRIETLYIYDQKEYKSYCGEMTLGGYTNWRLPKGKEFTNMGYYNNLLADSPFQNSQGYFWSIEQNLPESIKTFNIYGEDKDVKLFSEKEVTGLYNGTTSYGYGYSNSPLAALKCVRDSKSSTYQDDEPYITINSFVVDGRPTVSSTLTFKFSVDSSSSNLTYGIDWGTGSYAMITNTTTTHSFDKAGTYSIKLLVKDTNNTQTTKTIQVKILDLFSLNQNQIVENSVAIGKDWAKEEAKQECKADPASCGIVPKSYIKKSDITNKTAGWHLMGASANIDDMSIFDDIEMVWVFEDNAWKIYSKDDVIKKMAELNSMDIVKNIHEKSGFWIYKK
jgi:hypothetical protein